MRVRSREVAWRSVERRGRDGAPTDAVVVEEPLEIRVDGETVAVTMRTPGDGARLALGFLFGEGVVRSLDDVGTIAPCGRPGANIIDVRSGPGRALEIDRVLDSRRFVTSSACGVCGRRSIDDLLARCGRNRNGASISRPALADRSWSTSRTRRPFEPQRGKPC